MKRNLILSTKAKFIITKALLFMIIAFVGTHLIFQQQKVSFALHSRDDLRVLDEEVHSLSEELDNTILDMSLSQSSKENTNYSVWTEKLQKILQGAEDFNKPDSINLSGIIEKIKIGRDILEREREPLNALKELNSARLDLQKIDYSLDEKIESSRKSIRLLIDRDPYENFWILLSALSLIVALALVTATEIFAPMEKITKTILAAGHDTGNILKYLIESPSKSEVGMAQIALNNLFTHVHENMQALKAMSTEDARRLAAIEAIRDGVGMVNPAGILTYANRSLLKLHGIKEEDAADYIGKPWANLYSEKGIIEIRDHVFPILNEKGYWVGESIILRKDGEKRNMEMSLTLLEDGNMIGTARDITRRKAAEKEQEKFQELFAQSQKMEAVGRLTGGVAHDFNNILTIIGGNLDLIKDIEGDNAASTVKKSIATAERAVTRGAELTQRLLSFSRKQVLMPSTTNINKALPDMLILLSRATGEMVDLEFDMSDNLWNVKIDNGQLENALLNMIINARDAMPDGGNITISTENIWLNGQDISSSFKAKPGPYVKISISDTGHGIPPEAISKVFDPFFTTKKDGKGTGLGLSMVYGFVKQSGGYIAIESHKDVGTKVDLYFPRCEDEVSETLYIETVLSHHKAGNSETILIAEDEEDVLDLNRNMLSRLGYKVLCARNGAEALEVLKGTECIDLLLTDMVMPGGINGQQLADKASVLQPNIKIMMVSGYTNEPLSDSAGNENIRFLSKPYSQAKLADELRSLLNSRDSLLRFS